ncbi:4499_t:CDS:1, partial [Acaulospora morrowiae]
MTKEQGEKKTPIQMPPEIEALRLAALSTRNPKKEKKPELPIAETTLETAQQAFKSTTADDDEVFSEREEGELTDTDEQMGEASHTLTSEDNPICIKQEGNEQWRIQ